MNKITTNQSKTIKLTNVLKYKCLLNEEDFDFNTAIEKMQSYIKVKAAAQIGPLIQYTRSYINENSEMDMEIIMMLQCSNYIHSVEAPYSMESVLRVADCMYCRYIGPEDKLKFAYDKLNLEAFENDIQLKGESSSYFKVYIKPDNKYLVSKEGNKADITNGMAVEARIQYDEVTYFNYVLEALGVLTR